MAIITPDLVDGDLSSGHSSDDNGSSDIVHGDQENTNEDPVSESPDTAEESGQGETPNVSSHETFGRSRSQSIAQTSLQSVHDTASTSPPTEPLEDTNVDIVLAAAASLVIDQSTPDVSSDGILTPTATEQTNDSQAEDQVQVLCAPSSSASVDSAGAQAGERQMDHLESGHDSSDANEATADDDTAPAGVGVPDHVGPTKVGIEESSSGWQECRESVNSRKKTGRCTETTGRVNSQHQIWDSTMSIY